MSVDPSIELAINSTVRTILDHVKPQWVKDVQATLLKSDFQAATLSAQFFKMDHSLFKWDEKGFTFAGKPVGQKKQNEEDKKEKLSGLFRDVGTLKEEIGRAGIDLTEFKTDLNSQVERVRTRARVAQDDAADAKQKANSARNLVSSVERSTKLAAASAERASKSFSTLDQRISELESRF
ncbi:hypothetical protein [Streptomyces sp. NBC_00009]|uniref:hypothetical protein n=1 Tax=Streptomyces sp. NBC_00009 TaxID=2975620 RepID=UPI003249E3ED